MRERKRERRREIAREKIREREREREREKRHGQSFICLSDEGPDLYGVATISRLLKIVGLFCKRAL